jgi:nucleotide-binding universal stress UspA family protein
MNGNESAGEFRKFLVVIDGSPEVELALRYAARAAQHAHGQVTLLYVMSPVEFAHWLGVKEKMQDEARGEAESVVHNAARTINESSGLRPEIVICEGKKSEEVLRVIREDGAIVALILGALAGKQGPGPLVSLLASEHAGDFPVPITIVPGSLPPEKLDELI